VNLDTTFVTVAKSEGELWHYVVLVVAILKIFRNDQNTERKNVANRFLSNGDQLEPNKT